MTTAPRRLTIGIISWEGKHDAAAAIADSASSAADDLIVIYSNAEAADETGAGQWVKTHQSAFFGRKFRVLLDKVTPGHSLLLIQADASCADWPSLVNRYRTVSDKHPGIGLWSPDIDNTAFPNALVASGRKGDGLFDVVQTDAIVLGMCPEVLERLATLNYEQNNLGWGIDWAAIGFCVSKGLRVVRDLTETIEHPRARGYNSAQADLQMAEFLKQLSSSEAHGVNEAKKSIDANVVQRYGPSHFNLNMIEDLRAMSDSVFNDSTIFEDVSFLMLRSGNLLLSPKDPGQPFSVLLNGEQVLAVPRPASVKLPKVLNFDTSDESDLPGKLVSGEEFSCPGQSTKKFIILPENIPIRSDLIQPIEIDATVGDVYLCMGAAVRDANVDILVKWHNAHDPDKGDEVWTKLDTRFSGRNEMGAYQKIKVRIPDSGEGRILQIKLCIWRIFETSIEPAIVLCTRPYLISGTDGASVSLDMVMISDDEDAGSVPRFRIPITATGDEVKLVTTNRMYTLIPAPQSGVRLIHDGVDIEASADKSTLQSLQVNGRTIRLLWIGPESQKIVVHENLLANPGTTIELRDPTGNVIHAQFKSKQRAQSVQAGVRHADSALIDDLFSKDFYLSGFAPDERPEDPASHYLEEGWQKGRDPAPWFSTWHYLAMHSDISASGMNPFLHYCIAGRAEGRALPKLGNPAVGDVYAAHALAVAPGPHFEEFDPTIGVGRRKRAKVLAYYLPQFHSVAVNDENWGKGFTEWRNLPRALPRFMGHIQPRIPRDLGFYDLSEGDVMRRQIDMAKAAGLFGFCFYHYWFDGERVLETPMERMLADPSLDFPFCLMWTNENWTRTWDGFDKEVILGQNYRDEDDIPFIDDLARHMKDPRYIRIQDRPLFFIYRPGDIKNVNEKIKAWRELMRSRHGLDPVILMAQGFNDNDPRKYDLDGAIEFPPHKICKDLPPINGSVNLLDADYTGHIISYDAMTERSTNETRADFPLIRTVTPSWDNDARRPGRGMIIHGSTPAKFGAWCDEMLAFAQANPVHGEHFICVNAWNEWAEGAVLEPDMHYGAAYLNALSRALHNVPETSVGKKTKIVIVGHDAHNNGAQMLALAMGQVLKSHFGVSVTFVLGNDGPLLQRYQAVGPVHICKENSPVSEGIFAKLAAKGFDLAITNTSLSGRLVPALKAAGFKVISLIHELPNLLKSYKLEEQAMCIAAQSDHVIFPAEIVRQGFESFAGDIANVTEIFPQGLYNTSVLDIAPGDNGLRAELGLKPKTRIVLGAGYADLRKGIDRFVAAGLSLCKSHEDIAFLWVGAPAAEAMHWFQPEIDASGFGDRVRILGQRDDIARFFAASNAFYLSSREDPFPSVVLEALACGLPIIGHEGCGGCDELIRKHGMLLPQSNPSAVADAIFAMVNQHNSHAAKARKLEITEKYNFASYVYGLVQRLLPNHPKISAVVPNYKYEAYIGERLSTVFEQNYPLREVIVLDDASPDNSLAEIERTTAAAGRTIDLHVNQKNSGSPFPQWRKGVELAQGEYIWIGEADDSANPTFVSRLIKQMQLAGSVLGFTDSTQIDENGDHVGDSYKPYINQIEPGAFDKSFDMDGPEFLARYLSVKNVILNVSGVVFQRETLLDAFNAVGDELFTYSVAGDWRLYVAICARKGSRVSYLSDALNTHRRHRVSVTSALKVDKHLGEIERMHQLVASQVVLSKATKQMQKENYEACKAHLMP